MGEPRVSLLDLSKMKEEQREKLLKDLEKVGRKRHAVIDGELLTVAKKEGEIVGYAAIVPQKNSLYIENVKVKKEERRKGVASKLNEVIENVARDIKRSEAYGQAYSQEGKKFWKSKKYQSTKMGAGEEVSKRIPVKEGEVTALAINEIIERKKKKRRKKGRRGR